MVEYVPFTISLFQQQKGIISLNFMSNVTITDKSEDLIKQLNFTASITPADQ